jgi:hypothetical protein
MNLREFRVRLSYSWLLTSLHRSSVWNSELMVPSYLAVASALVLLLHIICSSKPIRSIYARLLPKATFQEESRAEERRAAHPIGFFAEAKEHVLEHGGIPIFAYKVARLAGCFTFLALSAVTFILYEEDSTDTNDFHTLGKWHRKPRRRRGNRDTLFSPGEWLHVAVCATTVRPPSGSLCNYPTADCLPAVCVVSCCFLSLSQT